MKSFHGSCFAVCFWTKCCHLPKCIGDFLAHRRIVWRHVCWYDFVVFNGMPWIDIFLVVKSKWFCKTSCSCS